MLKGLDAAHSDTNDEAFAERAFMLWANILVVIDTHLREAGTLREEILEILAMLHGTKEATIQSPRV